MPAASLECVRAKATEIIARIQDDPEFKALVEANPESILASAGLPTKVVVDPLVEHQPANHSAVTACPISCIVNSCHVTF